MLTAIIKKARFAIAILTIVFMLSGCGGNGTQQSLSCMPARIEQISEGGFVPDGSEAENEAVPSEKLKNEMLWGTWVLEGSGSVDELHISDMAFSLPFSDGSDKTVAVECLPKRLTFSPAWAGVSFSLSFGNGGRCLVHSNDLFGGSVKTIGEVATNSVLKENAVNDELGFALENHGFGFGGIEFQWLEKTPKDADVDYVFQVSDEGTRKIAYMITDDTLVIGITQATGFMDDFDENTLDESDITEVDYKYKLEGNRLTLTYGDETATYVPAVLESSSYGGVDLPKAGAVDGKAIDGICGITITADGETKIMGDDKHAGYQDTDITFEDDSKVKICLLGGETKEYTYLYSGDSLTLMRDGECAVYTIYEDAVASLNNRVDNAITIGDNGKIGIVGFRLEYYIENGFSTDFDLNQPIKPHKTSEPIALLYGDSGIIVKVTNPYVDKTAPLKDCIVSLASLVATSDDIYKGDTTVIGKTSYDEVEALYEAAYSVWNNALQYKAQPRMFSINLGLDDRIKFGNDIDAYYIFEDGILAECRFEIPELLYNGLQDNVEAAELRDMTPAEIKSTIEVRDDILDRLCKAFEESNLSVDINEDTGEIVMDSKILFATDKYEVSDDGKAYLDKLMGIYASVISDAEVIGNVKTIMFEGHTDSSGTFDYNLTLSQKRADAVADYCLNSPENGLSDKQRNALKPLISSQGFSYSDLVYDENGDEDMAASRRVSIKLYVEVPN